MNYARSDLILQGIECKTNNNSLNIKYSYICGIRPIRMLFSINFLCNLALHSLIYIFTFLRVFIYFCICRKYEFVFLMPGVGMLCYTCHKTCTENNFSAYFTVGLHLHWEGKPQGTCRRQSTKVSPAKWQEVNRRI